MYLTINSLARKHDFYFLSIKKLCTFAYLLKSISFLSVRKPRYVRVNTLLLSVKKAIAFFEDEGWSLLSECSNYTTHLTAVKNLSKPKFIQDFHIPEILIFPPDTSFHKHSAYQNGEIILQDKVMHNLCYDSLFGLCLTDFSSFFLGQLPSSAIVKSRTGICSTRYVCSSRNEVIALSCAYGEPRVQFLYLKFVLFINSSLNLI